MNFENPSVAVAHIKHCMEGINTKSLEGKHKEHCNTIVEKSKNWMKENFNADMCKAFRGKYSDKLTTGAERAAAWFEYDFVYKFSYEFEYGFDLANPVNTLPLVKGMAYNLGEAINMEEKTGALKLYWERNMMGEKATAMSGLALGCIMRG